MVFCYVVCDESKKYRASALELKRVLGLGGDNSARTWLHKLRRAMVHPSRDHLTGEVEFDEKYVGGVRKKVCGRGAEQKTILVMA